MSPRLSEIGFLIFCAGFELPCILKVPLSAGIPEGSSRSFEASAMTSSDSKSSSSCVAQRWFYLRQSASHMALFRCKSSCMDAGSAPC